MRLHLRTLVLMFVAATAGTFAEGKSTMKCPDGREVAKIDVAKVFPVYAKPFEAALKLMNLEIDKAKGGVEVTVAQHLETFRDKLNQEGAQLEDQLKLVLQAYAIDPCSQTNQQAFWNTTQLLIGKQKEAESAAAAARSQAASTTGQPRPGIRQSLPLYQAVDCDKTTSADVDVPFDLAPDEVISDARVEITSSSNLSGQSLSVLKIQGSVVRIRISITGLHATLFGCSGGGNAYVTVFATVEKHAS